METEKRHVGTVAHQTHLRDYQNYFSLRLSIFLTQCLMQQTTHSLLFDTSGEVRDFNILTITFVIQMKVRFVFLSTCHKCYVDAVTTIWPFKNFVVADHKDAIDQLVKPYYLRQGRTH